MEKPKQTIAVILPVYNGGAYLRESVESVLAQTVKNFEFLILDDASTDGSWDYLAALADRRIRLFRNKANKGLFFNLNFLINQSRGDLVKLWSQDDRMYPHCLQAFLEFHSQHSQVGFSYSGRDIINEKGEIRRQEGRDETPALVSPSLHARIAFYTGSIAGNIANVCIRRQALEKVGLFNETMMISGDFDMWVRLAELFDTGFIPGRLIQLRDHGAQLSRREELYIRHVQEDLQVYRYLQGYVAQDLCREGRRTMRSHKLVFYYTLMVNTLLKGNLGTARQFYKELAAFDNFWLLSLSFLKAKIRKPAPPVF